MVAVLEVACGPGDAEAVPWWSFCGSADHARLIHSLVTKKYCVPSRVEYQFLSFSSRFLDHGILYRRFLRALATLNHGYCRCYEAYGSREGRCRELGLQEAVTSENGHLKNAVRGDPSCHFVVE